MSKRQKKGWSLDETMDRKYAIGIVHLYTQEENKFYKTLNKEMRENYPADTNIWKRSGDLINRGIDILGPTEHTIVYRGCTELNDLPVKGRTFTFNQIISTTLDRETAKDFTDCKDGYFFEISNVYGVLVDDYSQYGYEEEVMIKSYYVFKVFEEHQTTEGYIVYKLDGQSDSYGRSESNSGNRAYSGILMQCLIVVITILTLGK
ncbi:uncharacterized protein LOC132718147 [Ruditapes philippinarum]|uniref:uncharacterized protein LOC132718147 n=1 Tax=Ruditapes philippinarum TaxID=129788 RepID=UPI00295C21EF|nr:uncharacterized protein LOC132718147 [Ruditapes philippinarum]